MNILYCGDSRIEKGLLLSALSLIRTVSEPLQIYIMTVHFSYKGREYQPVSEECLIKLRRLLKRTDPRSSAHLIDVSRDFLEELPDANMDTQFTPCCMLRLYADRIARLPDKILYLDNDVLCRQDPGEFYRQNMQRKELACVLDHYGRWFFCRKKGRQNYFNSGVLLLNLSEIRRTGLFRKCVTMCKEKKMFMPDQTALNKLTSYKTVWPRSFNEQRKLHENTVFQHFTTSFRLFPWLHTVSVKPWEKEKMHNILKLYEYDPLINELENFEEEYK